MRRLLLLATSGFALFAGPALSQDIALILGHDRYDALGRTARGADVLAATDELRDLGFAVQGLRNASGAEAAEAARTFAEGAQEAERLVVALSGRFATDGTRSWLLSADSPDPSLFALGGAISLESVLQVLGDYPGQSLLLLGGDPDADAAYDDWLSEGIGPLEIPQGVTVLRGPSRDIGDFLEDEVGAAGTDLMAAAADYRDIEPEGYAPRTMVLVPERRAAAPAPAQPSGNEALRIQQEEELWAAVQRMDTLRAYEDYLDRYPRGRFAEEAESRVDAILGEPNREARLVEEGLDLDRDERREIQRDLTLLDYNTRGIDGIFGPGTRGAVTNWQQQNGFPQTSYLTVEQINRLDAQSARRAAELEAEAERQREQQARLDRSYWEETGAQGDEAGFRAYLERYPDGQYADAAQARLDQIEEGKRQQAAAADRSAWDAARSGDTLASYRGYLDEQPQGDFRAEAQARIEALDSARTADNQQALAEEQQLGLNAITARLVEARLAELGLEPGTVDGTFDDNTRRALRRYQGARDLPATGFLSEGTVVRLLADTVNQVLR